MNHTLPCFALCRLLMSCLLLSVLAGCAGPQLSTTDGKGLSMERTLVLQQARSALGTPYRYGGSDAQGLDCSGLVQMAYLQAGISLPRSSSDQYQQLPHIKSARPGDLLFFATSSGSSVSHVGIYMGNDTMIHAPGSGRTVTTTSLSNGYWQEHYVGAAAPAP